MPEFKFFWDYMAEQLDRIRRVIDLFTALNIRYALVGGHAVSYHWKPRLTVDVDFIVPANALSRLERELPAAGFIVEKRGEILRAWDPSSDPKQDDSVVDLLPAEYNEAQREALRTAVEVRYQDLVLRVVTRPALVALKYLSAISGTRVHEDKLQDAVDIAHLVKKSWPAEDAGEARRLVTLSIPDCGGDFDRLVDDLLHGRPITI